MFFNYIFLLSNFYENGFVPQSGHKASVIIPVSKELWEDKKYYLQKLNVSSLNFCFAIINSVLAANKGSQQQIQDSLSTFFFLPNYIKQSGSYVMVADLEARKTKTLSSIESILKKQGIAPVSRNFICQNKSGLNEINNNFFYDHDFVDAIDNGNPVAAFSNLFRHVVSESAVNKYLIVPVKDEEDYKIKEKAVQDFENWVSENEGSYVELLTAFKTINSEYQQLENENRKLKFRIDNYNDYLKLLRETALLHADEYQRVNNEKQQLLQQRNYSSPAASGNTSMVPYSSNDINTELNNLRNNREEILNWYLKEYEVLPLWYKRFGHLIKIMSGKRKIKDYL